MSLNPGTAKQSPYSGGAEQPTHVPSKQSPYSGGGDKSLPVHSIGKKSSVKMSGLASRTVNPSPFSQNRQKGRIVGWRAGVGLTADRVREILRREKKTMRDYQGLTKALAKSPKVEETVDPLKGLPPRWQAFYSACPQYDGQAAYKHAEIDRRRREKAAAKEAAAETDPKLVSGNKNDKNEDQDSLTKEVADLKDKVRKRKLSVRDMTSLCAEWDQKLMRARTLDRDEAVIEERIKRKLAGESYKYGVLEGKLRSSDVYFKYMYEDTKAAADKKISSLQRSSALMLKQIDTLKKDVRELLKSAVDDRRTVDGSQMSDSGRQITGETTEVTVTGQTATYTGSGRQHTTETIRQPTDVRIAEEEALFGPASASEDEALDPKRGV